MQNITMDNFDLALLETLQQDANLTNTQLSEAINLSPSQCSRRRTALEKAGIIEGYRARLHPQKLGYEFQAITRVNLTTHSEDIAREFSVFVDQNPEIQAAYSVSGDADYVLLIRTRNLQNFADLVHRKLLPFQYVAQVRSEIVLMSLKEDGGLSLRP
ncbi:MAG: Lrp/AsnC family transcriptional regulator [Methyloligellaceae bacterium]